MTAEVPFRSLVVDQKDVRYVHGPGSRRLAEVPVGQTVEFSWDDSAVYPGTSRKFGVHVPAHVDNVYSLPVRRTSVEVLKSVRRRRVR